MRLTPYGACASVGLLLAMGLSGRAARRVALSAESVWDAGLFAIVSCFVTSRLLLVLSDPKAFVHYPLLILGLPSLTFGGIALAAVAVWLYLRRKRLPIASTLDTFAPCGALLAAFLELGHCLDGSEPGMPLTRGAGQPSPQLIPVSIYGILFALGLCAVLWIALTRSLPPGRIAAWGLLLGGGLAMGLDMLSLPLEIASGLPLEPGQFVALGSMLAGAGLWTWTERGERQSRQGRDTMRKVEVR